MDSVSTQSLGYPCIGPERELKRALEAHWAGRTDTAELGRSLERIEQLAWEAQAAAGIDRIGVGDASRYDSTLDWAVRFHAVPRRFAALRGSEQYFAMARGAPGIPALELTKWFDTNYHYLVPELDADWEPRLQAEDFLEAVDRAVSQLGRRAVPIVLGPLTFLRLSHIGGLTLTEALDRLLPLYEALLTSLGSRGWGPESDLHLAEVQIHEPALVLPWEAGAQRLFQATYDRLNSVGLPINLVTYFDDLGEAFPWASRLPVHLLSLDFTRGTSLDLLRRHGWPADKGLGAGVVNARNVWRCEPGQVLSLIDELKDLVGNVRVGLSASLRFVPHGLRREPSLAADLRRVLAFAEEKLDEVAQLGAVVRGGDRQAFREEAERAWDGFRRSAHGSAPVQSRVKRLSDSDFLRSQAYVDRRPQQLELPPFPVTTIGSFPQTGDLRRIRRQWKDGARSDDDYRAALDAVIRRTIADQERLGLDVLVHGEFERTDMVEYFAERLGGFSVTTHGWVQSYGSRCVRPPIIWDDVVRREALTLREFRVAQSATPRPVKGMLTGPVTILNWSFPRPDRARNDILLQLALALRDEIADLEAAGARAIQVDEPALREGLPLRPDRRAEYLQAAVAAFLLATGGARPETQIHSHMCYSDFGDIHAAIDQLDADVISLENARSGDGTLADIGRHGYARQIGPGVYDVHSPAVPGALAVAERLRAFLRHLDADQIWVNPDCGLKTRTWEEVLPSLENLVAAARQLRAEVQEPRRWG